MAPGGYAVLVFVILSGFVITHLLLSRPEPYRAYLARRFFRLYPTYFVALTASFVVVAAFSALQTSMPSAAVLLHRCVEKPGIKCGRAIARRSAGGAPFAPGGQALSA